MGKINPAEWNKVYRLTLVEDRTHLRIKFWRFSRLGFVLIGLTTIVVVSLLFWCIIALTPLRTTVPGYPDAHFKRGAIANALKIDSLENEMTRWALYAGNLSRILAGEETLGADSLLKSNTKEYLRKLSDAEIVRGDSILRNSVSNVEQFGLSDRKRNSLWKGSISSLPSKAPFPRPSTPCCIPPSISPLLQGQS